MLPRLVSTHSFPFFLIESHFQTPFEYLWYSIKKEPLELCFHQLHLQMLCQLSKAISKICFVVIHFSFPRLYGFLWSSISQIKLTNRLKPTNREYLLVGCHTFFYQTFECGSVSIDEQVEWNETRSLPNWQISVK